MFSMTAEESEALRALGLRLRRWRPAAGERQPRVGVP